MGANINTRDNGGMATVMKAARNGQLETVKYLVEAGADINTKSNSGQTAVAWAAKEGESAHRATQIRSPDSQFGFLYPNILNKTWNESLLSRRS